MLVKRRKLSIFLAAIILVLSLPIIAFARASEQIASYYIYALAARNGGIAVEFSIEGAGRMNKLGAESIRVYENRGTYWSLVEYPQEDDPGMSATNEFAHGGTIYCNGTAGVEYKVAVTVFAENNDGRDTRTQTFYVTPTSSRP